MYKCLSLSICVSYLFVCKVLLEECVCLFVYLSVYPMFVCRVAEEECVYSMSVCCLLICLLSIYLSFVYFYVCLSVVYLFVCCLFLCLSLYLSVCLSVGCRRRSVMRISCPVLCPATDSCCLPPSSSVWRSWPPWESRTRTVETRWVDSGVRCSALKLENRLRCQTAGMRTLNWEHSRHILHLWNLDLFFIKMFEK